MSGLWRKFGWVALFGLIGIGLAASCTNPPVFPDTSNYFIEFNPVYLDSLPGTDRAIGLLASGGYDANDLAVIVVSEAEFNALPRMWAYQLWAVSKTNGVVTRQVSTHKFLWDPYQHVAFEPSGAIIEPRKFNFQTDITQFDEIILSIEPYPDYFIIEGTGITPDRFEVIDEVFGGEPDLDLEFLTVANISSARSTYSLRFPVAVQFDSALGGYFLANVTADPATPSSVTSAANYGVWFGTPQLDDTILPSLVLPTLPENWVYEGWVIPPLPNPPLPISTGRFVDPLRSDLDSIYSGTLKVASTLHVPGEDFLQNRPSIAHTFPMNLVSPVGDTGWVFITIEPNNPDFAAVRSDIEQSPDINAGPFFYRLLQRVLPDSAHVPSFEAPDSNFFDLVNMHGKSPKFGHPGAPLIEIELSSN
jgi:hypothetical protein